MSCFGIRPVDRSCGSYGPGHQVHWIQAKKSAENPQPVIDVSIVVHPDGRVDFEGDELKLAMWNHDPGRLRYAVEYWGRCRVEAAIPSAGGARALRLPVQLGSVGRTNAVPSWCATAPGESASDFVARAMREDHGFTVPGRSLLAPDVVEG